jgi:hypothetical protein
LLGVADENCCFTLVDVGATGREKDSSVFSNSSFGKAFSSGELNIHPTRIISGTSIKYHTVLHVHHPRLVCMHK